jgi:hypothetical protein
VLSLISMENQHFSHLAMACFDDLPIDVVWLILKRYIRSSYANDDGSDRMECGDHYHRSLYNGRMAIIVIPLSHINKNIRRLLKSKSRFSTCCPNMWRFIKGSFFDIDGKPIF